MSLSQGQIISNQGYVAKARGKNLVRDNPYRIGLNNEETEWHWEWRKGFLEAHKDGLGGISEDVQRALIAEQSSFTIAQCNSRIDEINEAIKGLIFELELHRREISQAELHMREISQAELHDTLDICRVMKKAGRKVEAIKYYRDKNPSNIGLKQAKDVIDVLE